MLKIAGYKVQTLPFTDLVKVHDILHAEGPILSHYTEKTIGNILLFYWVDYNEEVNRFLIFRIEKGDLFNYLTGGKSLKQVIESKSSNFFFVTDINSANEHINTVMLSGYAIPEEYYPDDNSYYTLGMPQLYYGYLSENIYLRQLLEKSFVFKLEPTDSIHENTVSAKEAGNFLLNITKSIDSYIDFTATDKLKATIGDRSKLNRTVNQIRDRVSPRIADAALGSFEVSIAIDTIVTPAISPEVDEWQKQVIEGYKNDVLDVDFSQPDDAKAIVARFPDSDARKKIFDPILKILSNNDVSLSVRSYNEGFERDYKRNRPNEKFKEEILPKISVEEFIKAQELKTQIVTAVFKLPEGGNLSDLKKKELFENLLFTQEGNAPDIPILSPITIGDKTVTFSTPFQCTLILDQSSNTIQLINIRLDLHAEGTDISAMLESIKTQFVNLVVKRAENPDYADGITQELDRIGAKLT